VTTGVAQRPTPDLRHRPPQSSTTFTDMFSAMRVRNFRLYSASQSITNTGTWMQTIAQDWLVLELTGSATAVGITMALQFLPMLLFGVYGGMLADRFEKRSLLITTQTVNGVFTAVLAILTISGQVHVGEVYALALAGGFVFVVDSPARQVYVNELVPTSYVRNAIALNAAVFQTTRLVGPGLAGVLIATVGSGWVFAANAACYLLPIVPLLRIRRSELIAAPPANRETGQLRDTLRYVAARPHIGWTILLVGIVGTFGLNFPIVLTGMARNEFHGTAALYGLFNIMLAVGSISGALLAGSRSQVRLRQLTAGAAAFGVAQVAAGLAPDEATFLVLLVVMGVTNLTFQAMANASVQLGCDPAYRARVMGLYMLVFVGGTPIGAPIIGALTAALGARAGMVVCGAVPALAAVVIGLMLAGRREHRVALAT
jgi:MFS family permease